MLKELEKISLKILRIILKSKYLGFGILMLVLLITLFRVYVIKRTSKYIGNENIFTLTVLSIKKDNDKDTITFTDKEKLISYYQDFPYNVGDIVYIEGNLSKNKNNTIPNVFNYNKFLYNK